MNHVERKENQHPKKNNLHSTKLNEEMIDETLKDTFPASDAPAWYGGKDTKRAVSPSKD